MIYEACMYGILSCLISFLMTPYFAKAAFFLGIIDNPDGKIKLHKAATPYLGGVVIFSSMIIGMYCAGLLELAYYRNSIIGLFLLLGVGLIDDIYRMSPSKKFIGQAIACLFLLWSGFYLNSACFSSNFAYIISFFWLMTLINALNLVDIMDGLAGSISLCAFLGFALLAYSSLNTPLCLFSGILAGSLLGFLYHNKPDATIYLGDAGSLFLGGALGLAPFLLNTTGQRFNLHEFSASLIILGIPLMEIFLLICIRTYKGKAFYMGSPDHFACYLQAKSWNKREILSFVYVLASLLVFVAWMFFLQKVSYFATITHLVILLFSSLFAIYFSKSNVLKALKRCF